MAVEAHHIRRGAVVIVRVPEDTKAGRPAVVIRSNALAATPWAAALPFTTDLDTDMPQWVRVEATTGNGVRQRSRVMCDWPQTVWSVRIQSVIGMLDPASMTQVTASPRRWERARRTPNQASGAKRSRYETIRL